MNYTKEKGWYYIDGNHKSPSWSGVEFLYNFLVNNKSVGPYGKEIKQEDMELLQIGDMAQISFDGYKYAHSLIIVNIENRFSLNGIKIASHTFDSFNKAISEYSLNKVRFIHIEKVRKYWHRRSINIKFIKKNKRKRSKSTKMKKIMFVSLEAVHTSNLNDIKINREIAISLSY